MVPLENFNLFLFHPLNYRIFKGQRWQVENQNLAGKNKYIRYQYSNSNDSES